MVNGAAVTTLMLSPPGTRSDETGAEGDEEEQTQYYLDIRTEGGRTELPTDGSERLWIYAQVECNDPEVDTLSLTRSLRFTAGGANADWLKISAPRMSGGLKAVQVYAVPPTADAQLQTGTTFVRVGTLIEGKDVHGDVQLELIEEFYLEFA